MNQYDDLDQLILERIGGRDGIWLTNLNTLMVRVESKRIAEATGRAAFRVLDGRLKVLRNHGKIRFDSKRGWLLVR